MPSQLDAALQNILTWLNGDIPTAAEYPELFTPTFVSQVPYEAFSSGLQPLVTQSPWTLDRAEYLSETQAAVRFLGSASGLQVTLEITAEPPVRIAALLVQPVDLTPFVPPADQQEALTRLQALGEVALLRTDLDDHGCSDGFAYRPERVQATASSFKLWVLAALVEQIAAGTLSWEEPVEIRPEWFSLPSGRTQFETPGNTLSVRELANRMIAISDNTATDHLIHLLGRETVLETLASLDEAAFERNQPLLTTRDLFVLKFGAPELTTAFLNADRDQRLGLLEGAVATAPLPTVDEVTARMEAGPVLVDVLEWFASPVNLCQTLVLLSEDAVAREILAQSPGLPFDSQQWSYVGFKGGSEAGVLTTAWLHEDANGTTFVTIGMVENTTARIDEAEALQLMAALRDL